MPYPDVSDNDVVNIQVKQSLFGQVLLTSTFWQVKKVSPDVIDTGTVQTAVVAWWNDLGGAKSHYQTIQSTDLGYDELSSQVIYPTRVGRLFNSIAGDTGLFGAPSMPSNVSMVLKRVTGLATKRLLKSLVGQVGTLHIGGLAFQAVTGDFITEPTILSGLQSLGTFYCQPISLSAHSSMIPVLFHSTALLPSVTPVVHADASNEARIMRRRTVRVGI
jgi:hypothetical protein